jgi:predicted PurR-regulated permease PerM
VLQQIDGNVLNPIIVGDSTGVSEFWVMFSLLLFGNIFGVGGMIIAVPLFAVIYDIIKRLVHRGLRKHDCADILRRYNEDYNGAPPEES